MYVCIYMCVCKDIPAHIATGIEDHSDTTSILEGLRAINHHCFSTLLGDSNNFSCAVLYAYIQHMYVCKYIYIHMPI